MSRAKLQDAVFLVAVAACALLFVLRVADRARAPGGGEGAARAVQGETRQVDEERLRRLIRRGHLSDREAMHYASPEPPVTKESKAGP